MQVDTQQEIHIKRKKRQRTLHQIRDGLMSPPPHTRHVTPVAGELSFKCSGKDIPIHNININVENGDLKFSCDCKCSKIECSHCIHLNSVVLDMCYRFIENSEKSRDRLLDYQCLKNKVDELNDIFNEISLN